MQSIYPPIAYTTKKLDFHTDLNAMQHAPEIEVHDISVDQQKTIKRQHPADTSHDTTGESGRW